MATVALAISLVFAAGAVTYIVVAPRPAEKFTEFYILNATGTAGGYPTNLTVNQTGSVNLIVRNREFEVVAYEIRMYRAAMEAYFDVSANRTELREVSRTFISTYSFLLNTEEYWNESFSFRVTGPRIFRIYFNLHRLPNIQDIHEYLFLTIRVRT